MIAVQWVSFSQAKTIIQQATGVCLTERDLIILAESGDLRLGFNFRAVCKRECQLYLDGFSNAYKGLKDNSLANDIEESATSKLFQTHLSGKDDEFKRQWLKETLDSSNKELRYLLPYPLKVPFWGNPLKKISCEDWMTFALRYSLSQKILGARLPLSPTHLEKLITHAEASDNPDDILAKKLSLAFVLVESPNGEEEFPLAYSLIKDDIFVYGDSLDRYLNGTALVDETGTIDPNKHIQKGSVQRDIILQAVRDLGYDPAAIPQRQQGKRGVKALVWDQLKANTSLFGSRKAFDNTWQIARDYGEIKEQE